MSAVSDSCEILGSRISVLDCAEVVDALPGPWSGVTSAAGWGLWTVAWRGDA